jgi:hypothetical protein
MRHLLARALAVVTLLALPGLAAAQSCLGYPSLATNHLQISSDLAFGNPGSNIGFLYSYGSSTGFGGLGAGSNQSDSRSATTVRAQVGYQVPATASGRTQLCPTMSATVGFGPRDVPTPGTDQQTRRYEIGLALGRQFGGPGSLHLVPSLQLSVAHLNTSFSTGTPSSQNSTDPRVTLSFGIVLNVQISIRPTASRSLHRDQQDAMFGAGLALNFGGRR